MSENIGDVSKDIRDYLEALEEANYMLIQRKDIEKLTLLRFELANLEKKYEVRNDPLYEKYLVKGKSKVYEVKKWHSNKWTCNCPGFRYTKKECKHIKQKKEELKDA